ncbi:MAG: PAS domain-containing protein, partial [Gammaproteobacteria bacterium]
MDQKVSSIKLESLVNTHQKPFVIIDKNYRIIATNRAYEAAYGYVNGTAIGMKCHKVSHGNDVPCGQDGEVCPHDRVFATGESSVCAHSHFDIDNRRHQIKISAYPLEGADGEM